MSQLHRAERKQLLSDARRLETIAKRMRKQAHGLYVEEKINKLHSQGKQSKIDPDLSLPIEFPR